MSSAEARKRRMLGSCWCSLTNIFPLIIFIISKPGAVWCTVTDYHNNDGAQWMAAHWKTCFIIRMKLLSVYLAMQSPWKQPLYLIVAKRAEWENMVSKALKLPQLRDVQKISITFLQTKPAEMKSGGLIDVTRWMLLPFLPGQNPELLLTSAFRKYSQYNMLKLVNIYWSSWCYHTHRCSLSQQQQVVTFILCHQEGSERPDQISASHRWRSTAWCWPVWSQKPIFLFFLDRELSAASELNRIAFTPSHAVEFAFVSFLNEAGFVFFISLFTMLHTAPSRAHNQNTMLHIFQAFLYECRVQSCSKQFKGHKIEFLIMHAWSLAFVVMSGSEGSVWAVI